MTNAGPPCRTAGRLLRVLTLFSRVGVLDAVALILERRAIRLGESSPTVILAGVLARGHGEHNECSRHCCRTEITKTSGLIGGDCARAGTERAQIGRASCRERV